MPHILWDLVPPVTLYQDETSTLHTTAEGCGTEVGHLVKTSISEHVTPHGVLIPCKVGTCLTITATGIRDVHEILQCAQDLTDQLQGHVDPKALGREAGLAHAMLATDIHRVPMGLEETYLQAQEHIRSVLHEVTLHVRKDDVRDALYDKILESYEDNPSHVLSLYDADMTADEAGLLVGVLGDVGHASLARFLARAYGTRQGGGEPLIGSKFIMRAPMGVLINMGSPHRPGQQKNHAGQVVRLPPNYTPELEDIIVGLYEPYSHGKLSDLQMVVEVAQELCDRQ